MKLEKKFLTIYFTLLFPVNHWVGENTEQTSNSQNSNMENDKSESLKSM